MNMILSRFSLSFSCHCLSLSFSLSFALSQLCSVSISFFLHSLFCSQWISYTAYLWIYMYRSVFIYIFIFFYSVIGSHIVRLKQYIAHSIIKQWKRTIFVQHNKQWSFCRNCCFHSKVWTFDDFVIYIYIYLLIPLYFIGRHVQTTCLPCETLHRKLFIIKIFLLFSLSPVCCCYYFCFFSCCFV